jgi:hypothetical protein
VAVGAHIAVLSLLLAFTVGSVNMDVDVEVCNGGVVPAQWRGKKKRGRRGDDWGEKGKSVHSSKTFTYLCCEF